MTSPVSKKIFPIQWAGKSGQRLKVQSPVVICLLSTLFMGTAIGLIYLSPKRQKNTSLSTSSNCLLVSWRPTLITGVVLLTYRCPPEGLETPDFLVSSRYFNVETPSAKWGRLGESEEYFWETETEKKKINKHVFKHLDLDRIDQEFDR